MECFVAILPNSLDVGIQQPGCFRVLLTERDTQDAMARYVAHKGEGCLLHSAA